MSDLNLAVAVSAWRVRGLWTDSADGPYTTASAWAVLRDGVVSQAIAQVWAIDATTTEIAMDEPLLPGALYVLQHTASARTVSFAHHPGPAITHPDVLDELGDPEAEAFGVDVDWLTDALTGTRDLPEVRGLAALKHDLAALSITAPGELIHRPTAGVGLRQRVNSTASEAAVDDAQADVSAAFLADDRVTEVNIVIEQVPAQAITRMRVSVLTPQLPGESIDFVVRV